ncbi:SDR family NAD(P)-dependent oxidoreductase [Neptuniibacter sp. SY11_33]|uniref:SDR family NAD(P)-dependent oxidoreductase n=1 Tax=Neptuniibacter sp. SY11_33 TaxID=3398215 RepID=UPI0039F611F2
MKDERYLVTGATGFIGRALCKELIQSGKEVIALTRKHDNELEAIGVEIVVGEFDGDEVLEAVSRCSYVVHCAGNAKFGNGDVYYKENVELTKKLIDACLFKKDEVKRFVFLSTIGAVDRAKTDLCDFPLVEDSKLFPSSDYGKSKQDAEEIVKKSGLPYTIIRPAMVVGKKMRFNSHFAFFARAALTKSFFSKFAWEGEFSIVHVSDLVSSIILTSTNDRAIDQTFFCAGDKLKLSKFFVSCAPNVYRLPVKWLLPLLSLFWKFIPFSLKGLLAPALTADDTKLRELGWMPKYSPEVALEEVVKREKVRLDWMTDPDGVTVITGAASGLGLALFEKLKKHRKRILLIDIDEEGLKEAVADNLDCEYVVADLSCEDKIKSLLKSREWSSINISELYACAGVGFKGTIQELDSSKHALTYSLNVLSRLMIGQDVINNMQKKGFGRVVMISSSSAFQPLPYMASYASSNSALLSLVEAWGQEISGSGVQLMCVCPGGMKTNFQKNAGVKELENEKLMTPLEVADQILCAVNDGKTTVFVSPRTYAMSYLARFLPRKWSVLLWSKLMEKMR